MSEPPENSLDRQLDDVCRALARRRYRFRSERDLHDQAAEALIAAGIGVEREVRLAAADRIDLLAGQVGVEVKVASTPASVTSQLRRYAMSPRIGALVLLTTRPAHVRVPRLIAGKPVRFVSVATSAL